NSLIASDFSLMPDDLVRVRAFDWPVQFPAIKAGGFDAVVGNPPYIRIQTLQETDPEAVAYLDGHYRAAAKGNYDIYVVFVERALSLLNPNGRLGYILPHKFFNAQYGAALRQHVAESKHIAGIVHFGDQQIFEGATTYTCLLFLTRSACSKFWVTKVSDLQAWQANEAGAKGNLHASDVGAAEWNFHVGPDAELFTKLTAIRTTLGSIADRMAQGIRTSANEVYVLDITSGGSRIIYAQSEILQREIKVERKMISRFLQGRDIKRYTLLDSGKAVIIPYRQTESGLKLIAERELRESAPNTYEYLRQNKSYLESRERGRMRGQGWFGYVYPKNIDVMQRPKILVPDIADRASYALDEAGEFAFTSGYGITLKPEVKLSPKFVLGLLNSKVLDFFLKKISTTMRGGFFRYFTQFIEKLPIVQPDLSKSADRARHDRLVGLVDKMLALTPKLRAATADAERQTLQNAVTATDQQIDALVYELYGLTEEEIKLVEGVGKS
ncbi:MAG: Eco57I restriction-modification methylase domain-containing protein, partial [Verrucomicrobia bacterium]|nr:Eco57I restriction-modification methylase domain-containing protein [Verrucomicrobiota bacterium]